MDAAVPLSTSDDAPEVMTTGEAAKLLRVSQATVARLADTGAIPCFRLGRLRMFYRRELLDLPREQPRRPDPPRPAPRPVTPVRLARAVPAPARPAAPSPREDRSIVLGYVPRRLERAYVQDPSDGTHHIRRSPGMTLCRRRGTGWQSWRRQRGWTCDVCLVIDALPRVAKMDHHTIAVCAGHLAVGRDWRQKMPELAVKVDEALAGPGRPPKR